MTRTSTPSASFRSSSAAIRIPTSPSRQPNMRMWTDDCAPRCPRRCGGRSSRPRPTARSSPPSTRRSRAPRRAGASRSRRRTPRRRLRASRRHRVRRWWPARPLGDPEYLPVDEDEQGRSNEYDDREALASALPSTRVSVVAHCREEATGRGAVASRMGWFASVAVVVAVVGVFLTWTSVGSASLDGTQGPNNGWLVVIAGCIRSWLDPCDGSRLLDRSGRGTPRLGRHGLDNAGELARQPGRSRWNARFGRRSCPPCGCRARGLCRREVCASHATVRVGRRLRVTMSPCVSTSRPLRGLRLGEMQARAAST